jgi:hypothetical protein
MSLVLELSWSLRAADEAALANAAVQARNVRRLMFTTMHIAPQAEPLDSVHLYVGKLPGYHATPVAISRSWY